LNALGPTVGGLRSNNPNLKTQLVAGSNTDDASNGVTAAPVPVLASIKKEILQTRRQTPWKLKQGRKAPPFLLLPRFL
jgi:hypothetical protein